jgi:hypothetical protein
MLARRLDVRHYSSTSIPHSCCSSSTPRPAQAILPPASFTLHFVSLVAFSAVLYPSFHHPSTAAYSLPGDSHHVEKALPRFPYASTTAESPTGLCLTLHRTIPPPLISTPKPGSTSRLLLGHHITSERGVQEHESARRAARW